jgi:uncharacterized secreted protein with C-terminal beta-propeller domain
MNDITRTKIGVWMAMVLIIGTIVGTVFLTSSSTGHYTYDVNTFQSYDDFYLFFEQTVTNNQHNGYYYGSGPEITFAIRDNSLKKETASAKENVEFSETNVQVAGIDEPDIVKTDGTYLYIIANGSVFIIKAYPSEDAGIVSSISCDSFAPIDLFISDSYLVVFGTNSYGHRNNGEIILMYPYSQSQTTLIKVYDVDDVSNPSEVKNIEMDGSYFDARRIDDNVYIVSIEYLYTLYPLYEGNHSSIIPKVRIDNETILLEPSDVYYVDIPEEIDTTTHVAVIDLSTLDVSQKSFLLGSSQTLYVSFDHIYLASYHYPYYPLLRVSSKMEGSESTIIHKISIMNNDISYGAQGEVPGRILNQFSMDEFEGHFRIATTIGHVWDKAMPSMNNIYVLDEDLKQVGSIEGIAPGEQIYSARFLEEKAYVVTFKKIDPFFVIDLSDPTNPSILGSLKIPGYSDYLHPYDAEHIIGIGKDTVEAKEDETFWRNVDFAWYQGVKLAMFDVTDVSEPRELAKIIIGDRGTDSPALSDHKAFLFDKTKGLLVIPINLYEIDEELKDETGEYTGSLYGEFTFQGAYIYHVSLEDGFEYVGRITHLGIEDMQKSGFYPLYDASIVRTLYIEENLYTISNTMVKIHDLRDLTELAAISLL